MRSELLKHDTVKWKSFLISFTLIITLRLGETPPNTMFALNNIIMVLCLVLKDYFYDYC
jgi:hypothetical protein